MAYANDVGNEKQHAACARNYQQNVDKYKQKARKREIEARNFIRSKKLKCSRCPEAFHRCLDFHHLADKEFDIGRAVKLGMSIKRIAKEIEKCILLCANCHRKETYKKEL